VIPDPGFKVTVGKIGDFRNLSRHISETVQDMTKVAIDQQQGCVHALSIGTKINDIEWPLTRVSRSR